MLGMRTICSIYDVVGLVRPVPLSFLYMVIQQSDMSSLVSGVVHMQIASFTTNSIVRLVCCSYISMCHPIRWDDTKILQQLIRRFD